MSFRIRRVKRGKVLQSRPVAELVLVLRLNHGRPLRPQSAHRLEDIDYPLILHPLQDYAQGNENAGTPNAGTAMHGNGTFLTKLLLGLVNLANEIDESFTRLRNTLFGPISKLELAYGARRTVAGIGHFEFAQEVLGHIIFS